MTVADRFVTCELGHRHWGALGAAGVLLVEGDSVLLQHRISWSHHGGTWSTPGGALHPGETALDAAVRELAEESGIVVSDVRPAAEQVLDHGGWAYTTFVIVTSQRYASSIHHEQVATAWVPAAEVEALPLHPGFAETWPRLRSFAESGND